MSKVTHCLSASLFALSISSTHAATISYTSQTDYLSALGSAATIIQNFDSLAAGSLIADGDTLGGMTFSYSLSAPGNPSILVDNFFATTSGANYLGTDDGSGAFVGGDSIIISFDQTMRAVGLYVTSADLIFDGDFTITTSSGQSVSNLGFADINLTDGDAYYIGLIEDDFNLGFNSITLSSSDYGFLFNVDDVTVSAVPVPAAIWLMGSGLLGLAGLARRTTRKA